MNRTDHRWYRLLVAFMAVQLACLPTGCQYFRKAKPAEPIPVYESPSSPVDQASHDKPLRFDDNGNVIRSTDPNDPPPVENIQTPPPTTLMKVRKTVVDATLNVTGAIAVCVFGIIFFFMENSEDPEERRRREMFESMEKQQELQKQKRQQQRR
jgi:hypothetical protein